MSIVDQITALAESPAAPVTPKPETKSDALSTSETIVTLNHIMTSINLLVESYKALSEGRSLPRQAESEMRRYTTGIMVHIERLSKGDK